MGNGYGRSYDFDPAQYYAQTTVRSPSYNPLSPNPDFLGGIRNTINSIWAFKEMQKEQEQERRQQEFQNKLNQRRVDLDERQIAAREKALFAEKPKTAAQMKYEAIDARTDWTDEDKFNAKVFNLAPVNEELSGGGLKLAKLNNMNVDKMTPYQIREYNAAAIRQSLSFSTAAAKKATDAEEKAKADNDSYLSYYLLDNNKKINRIMRAKIPRLIENPDLATTKLSDPARKAMPKMVENPQYAAAQFELRALGAAKDLMEDILAKQTSGAPLSGEDKAMLHAISPDTASYSSLYACGL